MATLFGDPLDALLGLQQALDSFRASSWLQSSPSGGGGHPPVNVFRKGEDFIIVTEVPGIKRSDLEVQVRGNTVRLAGAKSLAYPEGAALHRRERLAGRFDRALALPVEIDPEGVKAECRDGVLALFLPRAERDKPKSIPVN
jgi:HSP20 family protein